MARIGADDPQAPTALDGAAMHADFLDRGFDFHTKLRPPRDPGLASIGIELQEDPVADEHLYPMQAHFAGKVRKYEFIAETHAEERIG